MATRKNSKIERYDLNEEHSEKIQFELYSLSEYLRDSEGCANEPHIHNFYQIIWFIEGNGKHYVDFNEYDFSPNTIFFIPKGQIHYFDKSPCNGYVIHFNEMFLSNEENYINIFLKHTIFNSFENEPLVNIENNKTKGIQHVVRQLQDELGQADQFAHKDYLKHLLNIFLIEVQRIGKRNNHKDLSITNPYHILFVKFRQLLETNYRKMHTVSEYADLLNVSTKTLTNHTKSVAHQTPLTIINERILLETKRLLVHSGLNVNEIAFELGFEDPSYFVKFFKRQVKISPIEFRTSIS